MYYLLANFNYFKHFLVGGQAVGQKTAEEANIYLWIAAEQNKYKYCKHDVVTFLALACQLKSYKGVYKVLVQKHAVQGSTWMSTVAAEKCV